MTRVPIGTRASAHHGATTRSALSPPTIPYCAGASLGKPEAQLAVEGLATRFPDLRLVEGQEIPIHPNISFRGPLELWVRAERALKPSTTGLTESRMSPGLERMPSGYNSTGMR
jgi:hypothetical protein